MPEGDSLARVEAQLGPVLTGRTLSGGSLRVPALATVRLQGRTVQNVSAYGKHLFMDLSGTATADGVSGGAVLHSHLSMEGRWVALPAGARIPAPAAKIRAVLEVPPGPGLPGARVAGIELGTLEALTPSERDALVADLGPDPIHAWDEERALALLSADPARPLGLALLDQRIVAGIGNIFRCECLFLARMDPFGPVGAHSEAELARLLGICAEQLQVNATRASRRTTPATSRERYWVYGRAGRPCPRGHGPVRRTLWGDPALLARRVGGRVGDTRPVEREIYWCPQCQPAVS